MRRRDWTMTVELRCGVSRARKSTGDNKLSDVETTSRTKRAEAAVAETPEDTNVAIAKRIGVSEMAVRRARKASTNSANAEMSSRTKRAEGHRLIHSDRITLGGAGMGAAASSAAR